VYTGRRNDVGLKGKKKVVSMIAEIRIWSCPKDLETVATLGEINAAA
jgi:hypothetical protein